MAQTLNKTLFMYFEAYKKWITQNPQQIGDIESTVKCLSFFTAGRFHNASLVAEFIYSLPNLLVLFNDRLIYNNKCAESKLPELQSKIKIWLTVVDYIEALLEISTKRLWGEAAKWLIIVLIQTSKTALRLLLVFRYKERVTQTPAIPPLNREKIKEQEGRGPVDDGFCLKRSGAIVRSVRNSNIAPNRMWTPLAPPICSDRSESNVQCSPSSRKNIILAETLYVIKPLLHLGCLSIRGQKRWSPWVLSFIVDLASLRLFSQEARAAKFSREEKEEICRRRIGLLLYLLRSPFYDNCSRMRIYSLLDLISRTVPFARIVANPIAKHLPHWQNTYFYMWSC
ncbi:peroxisomal membrane protein PEX16 [Belonocnema kinseyi]|uniref:peroxisomal membrane protein PEX16 n=1 Tax=Belonocnema kinseyi TaxID=2817044 RepID=UPI00143D5D99|nr:peroxisomal membrane protein PEX16 [Belonocnema kinseyi]XP_033216495.1 peroxisomal membrane protein PEX16 [Belonocnema kinseyi]XP_033216496.1 peroxisomal membrane protein PEX16 [Belonocnema kinseyi]XP_033216497.1 peroxisomal membrane protein PEX16 [Belonocnema kinseyi]XP_033216498.1 peroxisomal membrane protein PEX16 [Belonocnema kinseyi]XP_033216499.1 peroxisomal membrane protein PEX16 [Belonocnema kinseyi]